MTIKREPRLYPALKTKDADYAGRLDLIAECSGEWQGVALDGVYVIDWKSSKEPSEPEGYPEWPLQVSPYRRGAAANPKVKEYIDGACIVRLDKESGVPNVYDYSHSYEKDIETFHHLVRFYRSMYGGDYDTGIPSVTSILAVLAKPALIQWAANCSRDFILSEIEAWREMSPTDEIPYQLVQHWAEDAPKNYRKVSKAATDIGKDVHHLIEDDLKGKPEPNWNHILPQTENGFHAYLAFKEAVNLVPLHIELKVYGTVD